MNAARRVFYPRVQPPANWVHQVKALKFAQHPHPPPPQQAVCSRRTVVWQPGLGGPTLLQSKPVAMPALRVLHCKVLPPKNGTVDGSASVPTELEQAEKEPELEKDPAEVQAEEEMAKELARLEREEKARCEVCEAVVEATQLDVSVADVVALRLCRTKLLDALSAAQQAELPRVERQLAEQQRRRLHNALQDMKGQLRVSCRIRPLSAKEKAQQSDHAVYAIDSSHVGIVLPELPPRVFEFDSVFRPDCPQQVMEEIFDDCRDLVQSAVDGHNVTVMTYGQTGAGKTYTLFGNKSQEGLAQYMIREVFARLGDQESELSEHPKVTVCGSALELYNNHFIDLLRPIDRTGRQSPGVKVCVDSEGCVQVDGLAQLVAAEPQELLQILRRGLAQRVVAEHAMNADSSRSHMVFTVRLTVEGGAARKLTFCDLGGCERLKRTQVVGDLQKEAIEINKSLSALSSVIEAVAGRRQHVPYRDHKLTSLLRDAVGGTAKVLMYVCCSPAASNLEETAAALKLASRAAKVVNQRSEANEPAPEE